MMLFSNVDFFSLTDEVITPFFFIVFQCGTLMSSFFHQTRLSLDNFFPAQNSSNPNFAMTQQKQKLQ